MFDYRLAFNNQIEKIRNEGRYRDFIGLQRISEEFPKAIWGDKKKEVVNTILDSEVEMISLFPLRKSLEGIFEEQAKNI